MNNMKLRCKNCGYIYSYQLDNLDSCQMCNGPKNDIVEWNIDEGFIKQEKADEKIMFGKQEMILNGFNETKR